MVVYKGKWAGVGEQAERWWGFHWNAGRFFLTFVWVTRP